MLPPVSSQPPLGRPASADDADEAIDRLVEALLCSADPTTLSAIGGVDWRDGAVKAIVAIELNGVSWSMAAGDALVAAGRLMLTKTPDVARRQVYRACFYELTRAVETALTNASVARLRGVH